MDGSEKEGNQSYERQQTLARYALIAGVLILLAIVFYVLSSTVAYGSCNGILLGPSKDSCLLSLALSTNNYSICNSLSGAEAPSCYLAISESTNNQGLCASASQYGSEWGNECYSYFENKTGNAALCSDIVGSGGDQCFARAAISNYNSTYCANLSNSTLQAQCSESVSMNSALKAGDASYCAALNGTYSSSETAYLIEGLSTAKAANSELLESESSAYFSYFPQSNYSKSDVCYLFFSALEPGANYCADISDSNLESLCASSVANQGPAASGSTTNSTSANETGYSSYYGSLLDSCSAQNATLYSICTTSVRLIEAVQTKNVTICAGFAQNLSAECYQTMASTYGNATYCSYISNSSEEYSCTLGADGENYTYG